MVTWISSDPLRALGLGCAAGAALLLVWYLARRPRLTRATKVILLLAIGVLPIGTAATGNVAGYEATKAVRFCSSCHVMAPYGDDARDRDSGSLAARHSRNAAFGGESCYTCHADYGMFGTVTTKLGGLRHVYEYALNYRAMPIDEFLATIELRAPFPSSTCMRCHSTTGPAWNALGDHASAREALRAGAVGCTSEGCHGPAHPFSKAGRGRR